MKKETPDRSNPIEGRVVAPPKRSDLSRRSQQRRILDRLHNCGYVSTQQARNELEVLHPAGRVRELKHRGYWIETVMVPEPSPTGVVHRVAKYVLVMTNPASFGIEGAARGGDDA